MSIENSFEFFQEELVRLTSTDDPLRCADVLRRFVLKGSELRRSEASRFPIFAFRPDDSH